MVKASLTLTDTEAPPEMTPKAQTTDAHDRPESVLDRAVKRHMMMLKQAEASQTHRGIRRRKLLDADVRAAAN